MRRTLLLTFAAALLLATLRSCILPGPTTLVVHVFNAAQTVEVTPQMRLLVGYVPEGKQGAPHLGNITLVSPQEGTHNRFVVPFLKKIAIFVFAPGKDPVSSIVWLQNGEHLDHTITLPGDEL